MGVGGVAKTSVTAVARNCRGRMYLSMSSPCGRWNFFPPRRLHHLGTDDRFPLHDLRISQGR